MLFRSRRCALRLCTQRTPASSQPLVAQMRTLPAEMAAPGTREDQTRPLLAPNLKVTQLLAVNVCQLNTREHQGVQAVLSQGCLGRPSRSRETPQVLARPLCPSHNTHLNGINRKNLATSLRTQRSGQFSLYFGFRN